MNELTTQKNQLPDNLPDLSKFVIVGRERLNAVRAEIRAIDKVGLAKEVHEQKLAEAQDIAEAVLDAEVKIGELTSKMKKGVNRFSSNSGVTPKKKQLEDIGISKMQASRYEALADNPKLVEEAKAEAREDGDIVTRSDVMTKITAQYESRRQKEARELKEAKERAKDFEGEKIVSIGAVKQSTKDNKLIFQEFDEKLRKVKMATLQALIAFDDEIVKKAVRAADRRDLIKMQDDLQQQHRDILKLQRKIVEVLDEK